MENNLYGIRQSPLSLRKYLADKLEACVLAQSICHTFFFVGDKVIFVVYEDDLILLGRYDKDILYLSINVHELGVDLEQEDNSSGF